MDTINVNITFLRVYLKYCELKKLRFYTSLNKRQGSKPESILENCDNSELEKTVYLKIIF